MKKIILLFLAAVLLSSCSKENPLVPPAVPESKGVYIVNEGAFSQNNASLTYYNNETGEVSANVYSAANGGAALGDNANSMFIAGNRGFIAVDNSNKIEIINLNNFKSEGSVDAGSGGSPREIFMRDTVTGYATSLYTNQVIKFNALNKTVIKTISVGSYPEGIMEGNGKLFVANSGFGSSNTISVIDLSTDMVTKTLTVGYNPRVMIKGSDNNIYVVCTGSYVDTTLPGGVFRIDPVTASVTGSITMSKNPGEVCEISGSRLLVVDNDGVKSVSMDLSGAPSLLIPAAKVNAVTGIVYSIAYDNLKQQIYCGNPKDFTQDGEVVIFDLNGNEIKRIDTGINPGTIIIRNE